MNVLKAKVFVFSVMIVFLVFFSNDFGLIDIEKTAIITAVAIDVDGDEFSATLQVDIPVPTDANVENPPALIKGKGKTVGAAIKVAGDVSGWFPKLDFCNLIIIGKKIAEGNVITVLDYFSKTLRIQDSSVVVLSETTAEELISATTPLDNISSFAMQKTLLKTWGFDKDVVDSDIKTIVAGYYSDANSSIMPIVKIVKPEETSGVGTESDEFPESISVDSASGSSSGSSGGGSGGGSGGSGGDSGGSSSSGNVLFDARTTALFYKGVYVDKLDENETLAYNMLTERFENTTLEINDVQSETGEVVNYLLTVKKCQGKTSLDVKNGEPTADITVNLLCKISDQTSSGSDATDQKSLPLPDSVRKKTELTVYGYFENLVKKERETKVDFLKIKRCLYRYHHENYLKLKDSLTDIVKFNITVNVSGQK